MKNCWEKAHAWVIFLYYTAGFAGMILVTHPVLLLCVLGLLMTDECLTQGLKRALKVFLSDLVFGALIVGVNLLVNHRGPTTLASLWGMRLTGESFRYGLQLALFFLVSLRLFMAFSRAMSDEKILAMLGRRMPGLALLFSMILCLVPQVRADAAAYHRLQGRRPRVFSLLVNKTLEDGILRSISMHDRGYRTGRRSCFYRRPMRPGDVFWLAGIGVWFGLCLWVFLYGDFQCRYFPSIRIDPLPWYVWLLGCLYYGAPVLRRLCEEVVWLLSRRRIIATPTPERSRMR